jgi:hypothetical protein
MLAAMNDRDTIAKVREIVARHPLPDFILDLDVRLGDTDGDPAMWLAFQTTPDPGHWNAEVARRVVAINALQDALMPELLSAFEDRFPYFRYETARDLKVVPG